jgi:Protein of unknown function (DUF3187)
VSAMAGTHEQERPVATLRCACIGILGMACASVAHADDGGQFYGLLRSRDLTAFGFLRLDMRPAHAVSIEPGSWAIETEIGYQNTWALSPEVEQYLIGLEPTGRRKIGPAEVAAIEALPGENYLLDLETGTFDFTLHYKLSPNWTAYGILSAITYQGGFLDSSIEQFHDTFGFSSFGRPAVARDQATLIYNLKGAHVVFLEKPTDGGLLDPTIGFRYTGLQFSPNWRLSLEGAVKIPVSGKRLLLSTGRTDYGVQASVQHARNRHAFYVDVAAVYYAGATEPAKQDSQIVPTLILGYEYQLTARTNLNLQAYASPSVYSSDVTDLEELTGNKYQYSIGVRHRRDNVLFTFGFTENVQNINNTPDIGLQFGFAYVPHLSRARPIAQR